MVILKYDRSHQWNWLSEKSTYKRGITLSHSITLLKSYKNRWLSSSTCDIFLTNLRYSYTLLKSFFWSQIVLVKESVATNMCYFYLVLPKMIVLKYKNLVRLCLPKIFFPLKLPGSLGMSSLLACGFGALDGLRYFPPEFQKGASSCFGCTYTSPNQSLTRQNEGIFHLNSENSSFHPTPLPLFVQIVKLISEN